MRRLTRRGMPPSPGARCWRLLAPAVTATALILSVPIVWMLRVSFYPQDRSYGLAGWSVMQYVSALTDSLYLQSLALTVVYAFIVAIGTAVVGFPLGYAAARGRAQRWKKFFIMLPLTLSLVVNAYGWIAILGENGLLNSLLLALHVIKQPVQFLFGTGTVLLVLGHTYLPFQILSSMSVVAQIDPALEEGAASLRATRWTTFRRVIIPMALPGIVAGSTIVFVLTISSFIIPQLVGGVSIQMFGVLVYQQMMTILNWPFGAALSLVLLVVSLGFAGLLGLSATGRRRTDRALAE